MVKKVIGFNLDDLWLVLGVPVGGFVLLHLIIAGVLVFFHADSSLMLSGILLPICSGIVMLIVSIAHVGITYFQAIRFSQTRRRALGQTMALIGFEGGCSLAITALLTFLEQHFAPRLWLALTGYQALEWGIDGHVIPDPVLGTSSVSTAGGTLLIEDFSLAWWWFPLILLACIATGIIVGAIIARFGSRGGWTLWCIWMVCCFAPQLLGNRLILLDDFIWWILLVTGISAAAALVWSFYYLLHAPVKS